MPTPARPTCAATRRAGVRLDDVSQRFGDRRGARRRVAARRARRGRRGRRPERLRQDVAARPRLRPGRARRRARSTAAPAVLMPQRDSLLPWLTALDNAALPLRLAGATATRRAGRARPLLRELGLEGFETRAPARALGRHAPARRLPAHAAGRQAGAVPRRAVRRARRDHARRDAGLAGRRAGARAAHGPARHPRRRGGARARRPRARPLRRARAASSPSSRSTRRARATRTDPALVALRERALEELGA